MTAQPHAFARTDRSKLGVWWWTTDRWLLGATAALMFLGVMLSFASSPAATARIGIDQPFHFAIRQGFYAAAAAVILLSVSMLSPKGVRRVAFFIWIAAVLSMMALPFIGHAAKGATRWIQLGPLSLQPSEFVKPSLIVLVSWMFAETQKGEGVPGVSIAVGLYALTIGLLLIQPDIGQSLLITVAFGAAFFMAGVPFGWIAGMAGLAVAGMIGAYLTFDHVRSRFTRFLSPEGSDTHQVDRAAEAIGAGGLLGRGPGEGVMKRHVPDLHTDFIYSVAAEEYGLIFSLLLISLFAVLTLRGLLKAMKLTEPFEQVAAAGLFVLVGQQACINVAVNLNLIPTKGMTLPFISYGGSSMLAMGLTLGMALALTRKRPGGYSAPRRDADAFA
ncbi:MAG: putative lipid II flippase FtsW [Proteobacteria bacterium]|nr:putative lipid II flippase FtsW [Pseudomonadota bacterium]MBW3616607.1 putative lipid II flippase FtsW [Pseudomonadota bacterium]